MAYLRREKEIFEVDFSLETVWSAMANAVSTLDWTIEEKDETAHRMKITTKGAFLSYKSTLIVEAVSVSDVVTRLKITAETPTTTITGIVDFGRTSERIGLFLEALRKQLPPVGDKH